MLEDDALDWNLFEAWLALLEILFPRSSFESNDASNGSSSAPTLDSDDHGRTVP